MPNRPERMQIVLNQQFAPTVLRIEDDSAKHAGHSGARAGGETHYTVLLVSDRFAGLNRLGRHRLVNQALQPEFDLGLHALALVLKTPAEFSAQPPV